MKRIKQAKKPVIATTHDIRKEFPELVMRIERLCDELGDVVRDHDSGYGGTYNPIYAREREQINWRRLHLLAREAQEIAEWLALKED